MKGLKVSIYGGDGLTARTCYGYDLLGNRISETGAGAQLVTCP